MPPTLHPNPTSPHPNLTSAPQPMESGHLSATPMGHIAAKTEDFMCKVMAHHLCFMCKNRRLHVPPPDWGLLIRSSLIHLMAVVFISNLWPLAIRRSNGECLDIIGGFHRRLQIGSLTLASRKRRRSSNSSSTRARMHVREIIPGAGPRVLVTVSGLRHGMLDLRFRHPATVPLELVRAFCSVGCSRRTCGHFRT